MLTFKASQTKMDCQKGNKNFAWNKECVAIEPYYSYTEAKVHIISLRVTCLKQVVIGAS